MLKKLDKKNFLESTQGKETGCCPRFNPEPWNCKVLDWSKKKFIKSRLKTFFYIPIGFGRVVASLAAKIEKAKSNPETQLMLCDHVSMWSMNIYIAVSKEVPGENNVTMSGNFLSKVYEGSFKNTSKWQEDFSEYAKEEGFKIKKQYISYTTCPSCAKAYGKNYVVIVGKIMSNQLSPVQLKNKSN